MKLSIALLFVVLSGLAFAGRVASQEEREAPPTVVAAELGQTRNVHRAGELWFAGQFTPDDIALIRERGIERVIDLRTDGEVEWDEPGQVQAAGMQYVSLPLRAPDTFSDAAFDRVRELLRDGRPTLLKCGSANRVGGAWIPFRVLDQGVPLTIALQEAKGIGLRTPAYEQLAMAYVEGRLADGGAEEQSVKQGINDNFKSPELDVSHYVGIFEAESREVFSARNAVLAALRVEPGMRVADIGAGTGLYTLLFGKSVGESGWVYAVDIAPRFLQRILALAEKEKLANVGAVLCPENAVGLPPNSIDLAFVCDTYHHFEYPRSTLRSLFAALKPGGRFVVLDFERIPGVSREWLLDHVRAGKQVFRAEIEAAGFAFQRELEVEGLLENYVLEFAKPATAADR